MASTTQKVYGVLAHARRYAKAGQHDRAIEIIDEARELIDTAPRVVRRAAAVERATYAAAAAS